jgi:hypothetical protein
MKRKMILMGALLFFAIEPLAAQERNVASDTLSGAAKGAVIGAIAGDAGKGAAAGAVGSLLFGEMRRH